MKNSHVIIDTNILVFLIIGLIDIRLVLTHKKKLDFCNEQNYIVIFSKIIELIEGKKIVVTPNIVTELDNHLNGSFDGKYRYSYFQLLKERLSIYCEIYYKSTNLFNDYNIISNLGVTDTIILELAKNESIAVISSDTVLCDHLRSCNIEVEDIKWFANNIL